MTSKNRNEIINIRVESELKEKVSKIAFKNGTNLSELIRRFLEEYIKAHCGDKEN
ncbi:CopG family transcriptional regulator [Clostridium botulinum]|uniref:Transcriptional regulator, CopG family n=1 Tax=Clostridium botulinum D str. 1873 TaxID=592027 RepID=A0A9N7B8M6_CLOBO|nr:MULTISPECIES: ribbon-helix-helix domain-containing protein [Clostridium]MBO3441478.1 CopG family transcriptional regulator [Clostridium haemolyticum]MCD3217269.1 CopG family transcriptional regulator [Clostridium botulinum C]ACT33596.1 transcriptional regulator, CopG family [Clostridium botulinum D str. 1873]AYF55333.1 CopG family transcriptional regulator [Clostridium novyi]NFV47948.1 CopG family transcriptional regulator [Clostridium botulinum]